MRWSGVARAFVVLCLVVTGAVACGDDGEATDDASSSDGGSPSEVTAAQVEDAIDLSGDTGAVSESGRTTIPGFEEIAVEVTNQAGDVLEWCLLLARAAEQYTQGLMRVVDLGDYEGMLFDFPDDDPDRTGGFWMRDTALPLSIAYLDAEGAVVSTADMDPCLDLGVECPSYPPTGPYADTVEVVQGGLEELGLDGPDARLVPTGSCTPVST
jgi:uncharacterized membrane protein (UPF0127 family)